MIKKITTTITQVIEEDTKPNIKYEYVYNKYLDKLTIISDLFDNSKLVIENFKDLTKDGYYILEKIRFPSYQFWEDVKMFQEKLLKKDDVKAQETIEYNGSLDTLIVTFKHTNKQLDVEYNNNVNILEYYLYHDATNEVDEYKEVYSIIIPNFSDLRDFVFKLLKEYYPDYPYWRNLKRYSYDLYMKKFDL